MNILASLGVSSFEIWCQPRLTQMYLSIAFAIFSSILWCSSVQYLQKYDLYKKLSLFILIKNKTNCDNAWTFFPSCQGGKSNLVGNFCKILIKNNIELIFPMQSWVYSFWIKKETHYDFACIFFSSLPHNSSKGTAYFCMSLVFTK